MKLRGCLVLTTIAATACGFSPNGNSGTSAGDASTGGSADAPGSADAGSAHDASGVVADAAPTGCMAKWFSGTVPTFTNVQSLDVSLSDRVDRDPMLVNGGDTLYFSSDRFDPGVETDIVAVDRTPGSGFSSANVAEPSDMVMNINLGANESKVAFGSDRDDMIFASDRATATSDTSTVSHLWHSHRTAGQFPVPDQDDLAAVDATGDNQSDPTLSADGKRLYFAAAFSGKQRIMMASRDSVPGAFGSAVELTALTSGSGDADPALTGDEDVILFSSLRDGANGVDIYYAVRPSPSAAFGTPFPVATLNSNADDGDPIISADGCTVVFATNRNDPGNRTDYDVWAATMDVSQ